MPDGKSLHPKRLVLRWGFLIPRKKKYYIVGEASSTQAEKERVKPNPDWGSRGNHVSEYKKLIREH